MRYLQFLGPLNPPAIEGSLVKIEESPDEKGVIIRKALDGGADLTHAGRGVALNYA